MRKIPAHLITILLLIATMICSLAVITNAAAEPIVLDAADITIAIPEAMVNYFGMTQSYDVATGVKTITASKSAKINDGNRFYVKFADANVDIDAYPYIVVGMHTANTPTGQLDFDVSTDISGSRGRRLWGRKFTVPTGESIGKLIIDVPGYTGGEIGGYTDSRRDGHIYTDLQIRPGRGGETTNIGETIAFQYVAFFATLEEAEAFEYTYVAPTSRVIFYADEEGTEEFYSYYIKEAGENIVFPPTEPTSDSQQFMCWRNAPGYPSIPVTKDTIIEDMTTDFKVYPEFYDIFTVRFMIDEVTVFEEQTYLEGADLVLPEETPVADGYVFKSWICDREGKEVWANADYYADWAVTHNVRFYLDKNSELYSCIEVEDNCSLEEASSDPYPPQGYRFLGWAEDEFSEFVEPETIITRSMKLYPFFEQVIDNAMPSIIVSDSVAYCGKQMRVDVTIESNPGIAFMRLFLDYDSDILTLVGVEDHELLGHSVHTDDLNTLPYVLFWNNPTIKENITENGTAVTLVFDVAEDAPIGEETVISLSYDNADDDIMDTDFAAIDFDLTDGIITIKDPLYGDVNDDGKVTAIDGAYIARYLANWQGYEADKLDLVMSDVNLNGEVDAMDSVIISRHLARWTGYLTLPIEIE